MLAIAIIYQLPLDDMCVNSNSYHNSVMYLYFILILTGEVEAHIG